MRILFTGATGGIGIHLLPVLLEAGHVLLLPVRNIEKASEALPIIFQRKATFVLWKELTPEYLESFAAETVIHLAGYSSWRDDLETARKLVDTNIYLGTELLVLLGQSAASISSFINVGSATEFHNNSLSENPSYLYSATKTAFRSILRYFGNRVGFKTVHVVLYSVYGAKSKGKKITDYLLDAAKSTEDIDVSPGEQKIDFIHIRDVISFFTRLLDEIEGLTHAENTVYAGSGISHSIKQMAEVIEQVIGQKLRLRWGGLSYRERDTMISKAPLHKNPFDWKPTVSLLEGMSDYIKNQV